MEENTLENIIHDPDRWDMNRLDRELETDVLGELPEVSSVNRSDLGQLILFPLLALLVIAIVPILLSLNLFRIEETSLDRDFPFSSLESPILRAAVQDINDKRREIDLKDVQIRRYQDRVLNLDNSLRIMQELMDDTIQLKEQNLLTEIDIALGAERVRLEELGQSEEDINIRISQFKDDLDVRYDAQMEAFRLQEMYVYDQRLTGLRDERASLESALENAIRERQFLAEDLEADESELLAQLYEENDFIDIVNAGIDADLEILRESRNIENYWLNELSNQYIGLIDALAARDQDLARTHLAALEGLFSDEIVADLPGIEARNEADREIVRFFSAYLGSLESYDIDAVLAESRLLIDQAENHMDEGRYQEAELAWQRIGVTWPLLDRSINGYLTTRDELTAADVRRYVQVSKSSLTSGDFNRALAAWRTGLEQVPEPVGPELSDFWSFWEDVNTKRLADREEAALTAMTLEMEEASIRYGELQRREEIRRQNLIRANETERAQYNNRINRLSDELQIAESENTELNDSLELLRTQLAEKEPAADITEEMVPKKDLEDAETQIAGLEARVNFLEESLRTRAEPVTVQWRQYGVIVKVEGETLLIEPRSGQVPPGGTDVRIMRSLSGERVIHLADGFIVEANSRRASVRLSPNADGADTYGTPEKGDLIYITTP